MVQRIFDSSQRPLNLKVTQKLMGNFRHILLFVEQGERALLLSWQVESAKYRGSTNGPLDQLKEKLA